MMKIVAALTAVFLFAATAHAQRVLPDSFHFITGCGTFNANTVTMVEAYATFTFSNLETNDLTPRADGVYGSGKWDGQGGARPSYEWGWVPWLHQDPGHHDFLQAMRFFIMPAGHRSGCRTIVNGKDVAQSPGSVSPYPYEQFQRVVNLSHPGGVVEFYHARPDQPKGQQLQLLARLVIPEVSPQNPSLRWYYQGGGFWIGEYQGVPVLEIILSAMHRSYTFRVQGVPTAGFEN